MHKNLVTTISLKETDNDLNTLKGFQEVISDSAYGTNYTIYGKFKGEYHSDPNKNNFFKMEEVIFYLQNYTGQVTVGFLSFSNEIDILYHLDIDEPVYFVNIFVTSTLSKSFSSNINIEINDKTEELISPIPLQLDKFNLANKISINNYCETDLGEIINKKGKLYEDGYINLNYKFLFHINYVPNFEMLDFNSKDENGNFTWKKSTFLDNKNFIRNGEVIKVLNNSFLDVIIKNGFLERFKENIGKVEIAVAVDTGKGIVKNDPINPEICVSGFVKAI